MAEDSLLEGGFEDVERYHVRCRSKPGLFLTFSAGLAAFPGISLPVLACWRISVILLSLMSFN